VTSSSGKVSAQEKWGVAAIILLLLVAISLPYEVAATTPPLDGLTPPGAVYSGLLSSPDDQNVHLAWARQARDGAWRFRDLFTHESLSTRPLFTNAYSLLLGWMARVMPLIWAYHLLRLICAALMLWCF
jgi:hypothetical protein